MHWTRRAPLRVVAFVVAYQVSTPAAQAQLRTSNIFNNDSKTRMAASRTDVLWTVHLEGRCTGSMLNEKYLLTAEHCSPSVGEQYTSGACLDLGCSQDIKVVAVPETDANLDYAIVEVKWSRDDSRAQQRYSVKVLTDASELTLGKDAMATKLFTVGFPVDKPDTRRKINPVAYHAVGYAKKLSSYDLYYNVGTINGNSGGGVWTIADNMLVSMTNAGPHGHRSPGWDNNDPENSKAWNSGARMDEVYKQSKILKKVFPTGSNPDVDEDGYLLTP